MDAVIPLAGQAPVVTGEAGLADLPLRTNAWVQGLHMEAAAEDGDASDDEPENLDDPGSEDKA